MCILLPEVPFHVILILYATEYLKKRHTLQACESFRSRLKIVWGSHFEVFMSSGILYHLDLYIFTDV